MHKSSQPHKQMRSISRRGFLKAGVVSLGSCIFPQALMGAVSGIISPTRALAFYNLHTGERLKTVYWSLGAYVPEALDDINHILRDFRTGEIKPIETGLLDLLYTLRGRVESQEALHIISGYRSPDTNAQLSENSCGIAKNSLHMQGKAADIRLPGCSLEALHKAAVALKVGGVGYYPASDFVHVDIGRVRYW